MGCLPLIPRASPGSSPNAPVSDFLYLELAVFKINNAVPLHYFKLKPMLY